MQKTRELGAQSKGSLQCLTNYGVRIGSEGADELRADRNLELGEAPLGAEVLGEEGERFGQTVSRSGIRVITSH